MAKKKCTEREWIKKNFKDMNDPWLDIFICSPRKIFEEWSASLHEQHMPRSEHLFPQELLKADFLVGTVQEPAFLLEAPVLFEILRQKRAERLLEQNSHSPV